MAIFPLPARLTRLIDTGVWPTEAGPTLIAQQLKPLISADRVPLFAADETLICLERPPFRTIAQERALGGAGDFWERFGALDQIVPEKALIIGDFGLGSDSPIILEFARNPLNPLCYGCVGDQIGTPNGCKVRQTLTHSQTCSA